MLFRSQSVAAVVGKDVEKRLEISVVKDGNAIGGRIVYPMVSIFQLLIDSELAALGAWEAVNS